MTERQNLLAAIASTTSDYRAGQVPAPDAAHVDRWISQFDPNVQVPILRELNHILKKSYFSKAGVQTFLDGVSKTQKLVGANPAAFWSSVRLLDIQGGGASQKEFNSELVTLLSNSGLSSAPESAPVTTFMYLDDGLFTGNRIRRDLESWIATDAPASCALHIVVIALHTGGQYYANRYIRQAATGAGKTVQVTWWRAIELKDQKAETSVSDVLRPTALPTDPAVQSYASALRFPPVLRTPGNVGAAALFSDEAGRHLIEQEFLKAGVRIRQMCPNLGATQRPLGHMTLETLGFGSMIVTYRNCPNNAPLALWAGDPWYPLFPRKTNTGTALMKQFGF